MFALLILLVLQLCFAFPNYHCCSSISECKSQYGFCGSGPDFCGLGCQCGPCLNSTELESNTQIITQSTKQCQYTETFNQNDNLTYFHIDYCPDHFSELNDTGILALNQTCGTRLSSNDYFSYGTFSIKLLTAPSSGVVTSFILRSDETKRNDEIDFEYVGKDPNIIQTNFFLNSTLNYTNSEKHPLTYDLSKNETILTLDWNSDKVDYIVNDQIIRTLNNTGFHKPMRLQVAIWDGSETSGWAGRVWYKKDPYIAQIAYINMTTGC